jgi:hypothetical protein
MLRLIGTESKALGVHVQLGPVGGPLGKIPVVRKPRMKRAKCKAKTGDRQEETGRASQMTRTCLESQWQMYVDFSILPSC